MWSHITVLDQAVEDITNAFGDHNGMLGALDKENRLYLLQDTSELHPAFKPGVSPWITHVAVAGNGSFAASIHKEGSDHFTEVAEFSSYVEFEEWYTAPPEEAVNFGKRHRVPGRPHQLVASATAFICLTEAGEVYTWGDSRHRSLARSTLSPGSKAEEPGLVEALGGIKIVKISAGSWMIAALSEDGAVYLWGIGTPGKNTCIKTLRDVDSSEVALVDIWDNEKEDPLDIVDVAVGDGHVVVVVESGRIFGIGENGNGQLGLGDGRCFMEDWVETAMDAGQRWTAVHAGAKCTLATPDT